MIELPTSLVVLQWVVLSALALFIIVMYRQLGYLLGLLDAMSTGGGLDLNVPAPTFDYERALDHGEKSKFVPAGSKSVLLFVDPGCGSCSFAVEQLSKWAHRDDASDLRLVAVITAPDSALATTHELTNSGLEIARVEPQVPSRLYRVHATPFAYAIDERGMVVARGTVTRQRDIAVLVETLTSTAGSATTRSERGGSR